MSTAVWVTAELRCKLGSLTLSPEFLSFTRLFAWNRTDVRCIVAGCQLLQSFVLSLPRCGTWLLGPLGPGNPSGRNLMSQRTLCCHHNSTDWVVYSGLGLTALWLCNPRVLISRRWQVTRAFLLNHHLAEGEVAIQGPNSPLYHGTGPNKGWSPQLNHLLMFPQSAVLVVSKFPHEFWTRASYTQLWCAHLACEERRMLALLPPLMSKTVGGALNVDPS